MAQTETSRVENDSKQPRGDGVTQNENTSYNLDVILKKEEEENISSCQESSPKSRRKISKPKHYIPETSAINNINDEHNGTSGTSEASPSSPESVIPDQEGKVVSENAVHVMTASREKKKPEPKPRQRTVKKQKHGTPTVPRKPEDLIKEALSQGQVAPQASKRDAQYRKSYAYKIWKERGNQELQLEPSMEKNGVTAAKKLPPGPLQNQARAAFYWQSNQFNGTHSPGFFANGKYYAINPQLVPAIHREHQMPQTSLQVSTAAVSVATTALAIPSSVIQSSTADVVSQRVQLYSAVRNPDVKNTRPVTKAGPPNVTVVPNYPSKETREVKSPPLGKTSQSTNPVSTPISQANVVKYSPTQNLENFPAKNLETSETKASTATTSPSSLVSLMKNSLRQKHSKENVQPVSNLFKSKRKLETDKSDGPPSKKNGKPTIFTPLNEQEAEKLANDIYDVNLEYFPFQTLAEKAAQDEEKLAEMPGRKKKPGRVREIEKVRCLLKDFYDVTFSCTEDPDMQKFDSASRKFGRKNILNHLSLLDRYFAELQKNFDA